EHLRVVLGQGKILEQKIPAILPTENVVVTHESRAGETDKGGKPGAGDRRPARVRLLPRGQHEAAENLLVGSEENVARIVARLLDDRGDEAAEIVDKGATGLPAQLRLAGEGIDQQHGAVGL